MLRYLPLGPLAASLLLFVGCPPADTDDDDSAPIDDDDDDSTPIDDGLAENGWPSPS